MIISDNYRFAFIHIPKNAGTTIRTQLSGIDDRNGFYAVRRQDEYGKKRDFAHLTLAQLSRQYPDELARLKTYTTFCIVRDPFARFDAAVAEYAKQILHQEIALLSRQKRAELVTKIIEKLEKYGTGDLPHQLVWFTPQADYIQHDDECLVSRIFLMNGLFDAFDLIHEKTGIRITEQARKNPRLEFRTGLVRRMANVGTHAKLLLPTKWYTAIRHTMRSALISQCSSRDEQIFSGNTGRDEFIRKFYARDFKILEATLRDNTSAEATAN